MGAVWGVGGGCGEGGRAVEGGAGAGAGEGEGGVLGAGGFVEGEGVAEGERGEVSRGARMGSEMFRCLDLNIYIMHTRQKYVLIDRYATNVTQRR